MAHKFDLKEFAMDAVVPAVAINVAGAIEPKLDNWINNNATLGKYIGSNASMNKNAAKAKYMKAGLYTGGGLVVQILQMMFGGKSTEKVADTVGLFAYGLSGATLAEDPVLNVPNPQYQRAGMGAAAPARQVAVRTGNVIS